MQVSFVYQHTPGQLERKWNSPVWRDINLLVKPRSYAERVLHGTILQSRVVVSSQSLGRQAWYMGVGEGKLAVFIWLTDYIYLACITWLLMFVTDADRDTWLIKSYTAVNCLIKWRKNTTLSEQFQKPLETT